MTDLERDYKDVLLGQHEGPCISLYQPTHRTFPDRKQDPIRFGNLVKEVESSLARQFSGKDYAPILKRFQELEDDSQFWNHTLDGIAVFATRDIFKVYNLQRPVTERVIVADNFHTKPLMRVLQSADRFHVLGLSRDAATLFEGNRYQLDAVDTGPDFPHNSGDVFEAADGEPERQKRAFGKEGSGHTTRHGMNTRQAEMENETRQYFRAVDSAVADGFSKPSGNPLVLAALSEHHHAFRDISRNPALMEDAIDVNPASVSADDLREKAWALVLPRYLERLEGLVEQFGAAKAQDRGSDDLSEVAKAAAAGRVATVLIDADRVVPGRFDRDKGTVEFARLEDPDVDDVLDDLGEHILVTGGDVVVVPAESMPSDTGLAAIYRF